MARFYQAPVIQPIDYTEDVPFKELYLGLQSAQKSYDSYNPIYPQAWSKDEGTLKEIVTEQEAAKENVVKLYSKDVNEGAKAMKKLIDEQARAIRDPFSRYNALQNSYNTIASTIKSIEESDLPIDQKAKAKARFVGTAPQTVTGEVDELGFEKFNHPSQMDIPKYTDVLATLTEYASKMDPHEWASDTYVDEQGKVNKRDPWAIGADGFLRSVGGTGRILTADEIMSRLGPINDPMINNYLRFETENDLYSSGVTPETIEMAKEQGLVPVGATYDDVLSNKMSQKFQSYVAQAGIIKQVDDQTSFNRSMTALPQHIFDAQGGPGDMETAMTIEALTTITPPQPATPSELNNQIKDLEVAEASVVDNFKRYMDENDIKSLPLEVDGQIIGEPGDVNPVANGIDHSLMIASYNSTMSQIKKDREDLIEYKKKIAKDVGIDIDSYTFDDFYKNNSENLIQGVDEAILTGHNMLSPGAEGERVSAGRTGEGKVKGTNKESINKLMSGEIESIDVQLIYGSTGTSLTLTKEDFLSTMNRNVDVLYYNDFRYKKYEEKMRAAAEPYQVKVGVSNFGSKSLNSRMTDIGTTLIATQTQGLKHFKSDKDFSLDEYDNITKNNVLYGGDFWDPGEGKRKIVYSIYPSGEKQGVPEAVEMDAPIGYFEAAIESLKLQDSDRYTNILKEQALSQVNQASLETLGKADMSFGPGSKASFHITHVNKLNIEDLPPGTMYVAQIGYGDNRRDEPFSNLDALANRYIQYYIALTNKQNAGTTTR